jgi:monoamine oxidase
VSSPDVVIAGAGFAGLRAARDLTDAGADVVVVEARDRLGGRTWTRRFADSDQQVELGGSWFTPEQLEVPAELERYGLTIREFELPQVVRWGTGGTLRDGLPVPAGQIGELERALVTLAGDARRYRDDTLGSVGSLSCTEYIERLSVPLEVAEFLTAWYVMIGGTHPARGAVADALAAIASHGGTPSTLLSALRYAPVEGWSALARSIGEELDVRLDAPVVAVRQSDGAVSIELGSGAALTAGVVIVALPVNVLPQVEFQPELPARSKAGAGANAGRALKVWVRARGLPPGSLAAGLGHGIHWLYADRLLPDESVLALGFGYQDDDFDPSRRRDVERALAAFWPEATLLDHDFHDWNTDPWSRGTWLTEPAGGAGLVTADSFPPHGRLCFAGADVAPREAGWIEGALISGAEAARWAASV